MLCLAPCDPYGDGQNPSALGHVETACSKRAPSPVLTKTVYRGQTASVHWLRHRPSKRSGYQRRWSETLDHVRRPCAHHNRRDHAKRGKWSPQPVGRLRRVYGKDREYWYVLSNGDLRLRCWQGPCSLRQFNRSVNYLLSPVLINRKRCGCSSNSSST